LLWSPTNGAASLARQARALFRFAKQMTAHRRQGICDTVLP